MAGRSTIHAIHAGEFMGIPATGKEVTISDMAIVRFEDGKVVDIWELVDSLGVLQQLDAAPVPATAGT